MVGCRLPAVALCFLSLFAACAQPPAKPLTPEQQMELKTFAGQLADPSRSAKTKLEAAELLLARNHPQADKILKEFLSDSTNHPAQIAVAEGIAKLGAARNELVIPLMAMLTGEEASVRSPAARALGTYKDSKVTEGLIQIALDRKREQAIRLHTISALERVLDKMAVDTLVRLLDDRDVAIRDAAAEALAKLTNIRAFGADRRQWRQWWERNRHKPQSEWLADLADSFARSKAALEIENNRLRDRLVKAMEDLYAAIAPARRDALLMSLLKDSLADVRLVGVKLIERRLSAAEKVSAQIRLQVRGMLVDSAPAVRKSSALLVANLGDGEALKAVLGRLKVEPVPEVREALLTALGQLHDPAALPAVLAELDSKQTNVAAAAARALGRIVEEYPLEGDPLAQAEKALVERYRRNADAESPPDLREALLTAMGVLGSKRFVPVLCDALKDSSAVVRLAAVNGLLTLGSPQHAAAIAALADDTDRGVRQAVIVALGALDGGQHLPIFLERTDPAAESDAAVRRQAWDAAMRVLEKSDAKTLSKVVADLTDRRDAADQRIRILQMLVGALRRVKSPDLPAGLRQLGMELVKANRPAEAAIHLAEAYSALAAAKNPDAGVVWNQWVDALLAAADPAVAKAMADQSDKGVSAGALTRMEEKLAGLAAQSKWAEVMQMSAAALKALGDRLTDEQRRRFQGFLSNARAGQLAADRKRVGTLTAQLLAADESVRKAAAAELQAMGNRAVVPLLQELRTAVASEKPSPGIEEAVLAVLKQIAPGLNGYDLSASAAERVRRIDAWLNGA